MPETRYISEYKDGKLVKRIPYQVSDEELAEELVNRKMAELRELLKQGAEIVISKPPAGKSAARNIFINPTDGEINHEEQ